MAWLVQVALNMMQHLNEGVCGGLALHRAVLPRMDVWRHLLVYPPAHKVLQHLAHIGGELSMLYTNTAIAITNVVNIQSEAAAAAAFMTSGAALRPRDPGPTWLLLVQNNYTFVFGIALHSRPLQVQEEVEVECSSDQP